VHSIERFSGQEAMVIFDDAFIPNHLLFLDEEHEFAALLVERFAAAPGSSLQSAARSPEAARSSKWCQFADPWYSRSSGANICRSRQGSSKGIPSEIQSL